MKKLNRDASQEASRLQAERDREAQAYLNAKTPEQEAWGLLLDEPARTDKIDMFGGENAFLNNFFPCEIEYNGVVCPTTEHAFQAQKSLDIDFHKKVAAVASPGLAKKMGREISLRKDWEEIKDQVMEDVLRLKFTKPWFAEKLTQTGAAYLEEANWWGDTYWGTCNGHGKNMLGLLLMKIRDEEE